MIKISIVCVGKIKEKFFRDAIDEYSKRLSRYSKLNIIEVADEMTPDGASAVREDQIREKEGVRILAKLPQDALILGLLAELGEPDESGRRRPVEVPGSEFVMELDTVIMSLGTSPNPLISSTTKGLDTNKWKCIIADENNGKTTKEGVYAGGDAVTGAATVILAMGAGKAAAKGIDEYLSAK